MPLLRARHNTHSRLGVERKQVWCIISPLRVHKKVMVFAQLMLLLTQSRRQAMC